MTVRDIITEWLKKNGYTGLVHPEGCWCDLREKIGCGCCMNCEPERLKTIEEKGQAGLFE